MDRFQDLKQARAIIREAIKDVGECTVPLSYWSKPRPVKAVLKSASKHLLDQMVGILKEILEQIKEETDDYVKSMCED